MLPATTCTSLVQRLGSLACGWPNFCLLNLNQVEFFEPFWDSGEPRVGEKGARGWRAWMHQQERGGWVLVTPGECFQRVGTCLLCWARCPTSWLFLCRSCFTEAA